MVQYRSITTFNPLTLKIINELTGKDEEAIKKELRQLKFQSMQSSIKYTESKDGKVRITVTYFNDEVELEINGPDYAVFTSSKIVLLDNNIPETLSASLIGKPLKHIIDMEWAEDCRIKSINRSYTNQTVDSVHIKYAVVE